MTQSIFKHYLDGHDDHFYAVELELFYWNEIKHRVEKKIKKRRYKGRNIFLAFIIAIKGENYSEVNAYK